MAAWQMRGLFASLSRHLLQQLRWIAHSLSIRYEKAGA
jgi:hypothetical protein